MALKSIVPAANAHVPINQNFKSLEATAVFAKREEASSALIWAYHGGNWSDYTVADGTLTLTDNATNYIVASRTDGVVSLSTTTTNWLDTVNYGRIGIQVTASGLQTTWTDKRIGGAGILSQSGVEIYAGGGSGASATYYLDHTDKLTGDTDSIGIKTLQRSASDDTEETVSTVVNASTAMMGTAFEDGEIGSTIIPAGLWAFDLYCYASSTNGVNEIMPSVYVNRAQTGTVTITGTGTSRTATVTGSTPFVAGHANANMEQCSWLRTPNAQLRITAYTSSTVVTVECLSTYANESGAAFALDEYYFHTTTGDIDDIAITLKEVSYFAPAEVCSATDKIVLRLFAKTDATSNRTLTFKYGGTQYYSHVDTPLQMLHNDFAGLNIGDYQHLTQAEKSLLMSAPLGGNYNGAPSASFVMMRHPVVIPFNIPSGMTGSVAKAEVAATAQTDFDCQKNGVSFGTIRFAAAGTTATFIAGSQTSFVSGDVLKVVAPSTPDATLADIGFTFLITKVI